MDKSQLLTSKLGIPDVNTWEQNQNEIVYDHYDSHYLKDFNCFFYLDLFKI